MLTGLSGMSGLSAIAGGRTIRTQLRALGFDIILLAGYGSQTEDGSTAAIGDSVAYVQGQSGNAYDYARQLESDRRPSIAVGASSRKAWHCLSQYLFAPDITDTDSCVYIYAGSSVNRTYEQFIATEAFRCGEAGGASIDVTVDGHGGIPFNGQTFDHDRIVSFCVGVDGPKEAFELYVDGEFVNKLFQTSSQSFSNMSVGADAPEGDLSSGSLSQIGGIDYVSNGLIYAVLRGPLSARARAEAALADYLGIYHPDARWITRYSISQQDAIHAAKLTKEQADAMTADATMVDWVTRAGINGGRFSGTATLVAHKAYLDAIDSASIPRTSLKRVNTFSGANLAACMVPVIASAGFPVDENHNFVAGDYSEGLGLQGYAGGDGAKFINTGLNPSTSLVSLSTHLAVYNKSSALSGATNCSGVIDASNGGHFRIYCPYNGDGFFYSDQYDPGSGRISAAIGTPYGFLLASRTSDTSHAIYRNGAKLAEGSNVPVFTELPNGNLYIFALNERSSELSNNSTQYSDQLFGGYSIGSGLTEAQAIAYSAAWEALQDALGRGVA